MLKNFIAIFEEELEKALASKTSFGRIELRIMLKDCIQRALLRVVE